MYGWKTWLGSNVSWFVCLHGTWLGNNVSWFIYLQETWLGNNVSWFVYLHETWLGNNVSWLIIYLHQTWLGNIVSWLVHLWETCACLQLAFEASGCGILLVAIASSLVTCKYASLQARYKFSTFSNHKRVHFTRME